VGMADDGIIIIAQCVRAVCYFGRGTCGVLEWTWYVQVASDSGQTGRVSGKCWFVVMFTVFTVHKMVLRFPN
jgi:hypothetical protein